MQYYCCVNRQFLNLPACILLRRRSSESTTVNSRVRMNDKLAALYWWHWTFSGGTSREHWGAMGGRFGSQPAAYLAGHLSAVGDVGQIHAVEANVRHAYSVTSPVEGAENCREPGGHLATFCSVHVGGACAVARAARKGAPRH